MAVIRQEARGNAREPGCGNAGTPEIGDRDSLGIKFCGIQRSGKSHAISDRQKRRETIWRFLMNASTGEGRLNRRRTRP